MSSYFRPAVLGYKAHWDHSLSCVLRYWVVEVVVVVIILIPYIIKYRINGKIVFLAHAVKVGTHAVQVGTSNKEPRNACMWQSPKVYF